MVPFLRFFAIFRSDFRKYFYGVFGLLMQRNGQKRDKKKSMGKDERKKVFFLSTFSDFLPKVFVVFSSSSCRETAKNAIKKNRREKTKGKKFFFLSVNSVIETRNNKNQCAKFYVSFLRDFLDLCLVSSRWNCQQITFDGHNLQILNRRPSWCLQQDGLCRRSRRCVPSTRWSSSSK